jgi:hypothetical protein
VVCVAAPDNVPVVIARRRVTLIDPGVPTMPYHHEARAMTDAAADALIARVRGSIAAHASEAVKRVVAEFTPAHDVVSLVIRKPPFDDLPDTYSPVRESYSLMCAADGMMYQLAICRAAREQGLDVQLCRRGEETSWAARELDVKPGAIETFVNHTGRPDGPPWAQEHRRAYAAAIAALAPRARGLRLST